MVQSLFTWIGNHGVLATWLGIISIAIFIISLLTLPWLVSLIPEDYFAHQNREPPEWSAMHPFIRLIALILKNILGLTLLAGGILMLVFPGQGLMTIIVGMLLIDYPGKYQLERWVVSIPSVMRSINWLRDKRGKPPLIVD